MNSNPSTATGALEVASPPERRIDPALLLGTVLLGLAIAALLTVRPWRRTQVSWSKDLPAALLAAKKSHHLVFVEVYADWCDPCRRMERDTFSEPSVGKALQGMNSVHLNDDQAEVQSLMNSWGAVALPAHLILNPDGTVRARGLGYMPPEAFIDWIGNGASGS